jgi:hypothetical protein
MFAMLLWIGFLFVVLTLTGIKVEINSFTNVQDRFLPGVAFADTARQGGHNRESIVCLLAVCDKGDKAPIADAGREDAKTQK